MIPSASLRAGLFGEYLGVAIRPEDMQNAFRAPPAPRWPKTDPTRPMSDKAAQLLCVGGILSSTRPTDRRGA